MSAFLPFHLKVSLVEYVVSISASKWSILFRAYRIHTYVFGHRNIYQCTSDSELYRCEWNQLRLRTGALPSTSGWGEVCLFSDGPHSAGPLTECSIDRRMRERPAPYPVMGDIDVRSHHCQKSNIYENQIFVARLRYFVSCTRIIS